MLYEKDHIWQRNKCALWGNKTDKTFDVNVEDNFLPKEMRDFSKGRKIGLE